MQTKNIQDKYFEGNIYPEIDREYFNRCSREELLLCTHYPYIGDEKLQDGQEVVEGKDYQLNHQTKQYDDFFDGMKYEWKNVQPFEYEIWDQARRIVAIGIPKAIDSLFDKVEKALDRHKFNGHDSVFVSEKTEEKETQEDMWIDLFAMIISGKWNMTETSKRFHLTRKP